MRLRALLRRLRASSGYTLVELLGVMAILLTILTALTGLFVAGARAELDANKRLDTQQEARTAIDRMRRDIHCGSALTLSSAASITVTLPAQCPGTGGVQTTVVYDTQSVSGRYELRRAGSRIADYLTTGNIFSYVAQSTTTLGKLHVDLPVNITPSEGWRTWRLVADVVLRNTTRT